MIGIISIDEVEICVFKNSILVIANNTSHQN